MKYNNIFKKHPLITKLYIYIAIISVIGISRHAFYRESIPAGFVVTEILIILLILIIIFFTDRYYRSANNQISTLKTEYQQEKTEWNNEKQSLLIKINEFEEKENAATRFSSYQEKVLKKLFESKQNILSKHNLLHLLAEIFQAGAIILYKQSEPDGLFIVEETYALPEEFSPQPFSAGEGFNGQAVLDRNVMEIDDIPEPCLTVSSSLGKACGNFLYLLPVIENDRCIYLIELTTFKKSQIVKMWSNIASKLIEGKIL